MRLISRLCFVAIATAPVFGSAAQPAADLAGYKETVEPFLETYCLECHDSLTEKGKVNLEDFESATDLRHSSLGSDVV